MRIGSALPLKPLLATLLLACAAARGPANDDDAAVSTQPTRVLIVDIDDVGFDLLERTTTPTLDWLTKNGRAYSRFLSAPVCSPTRAMMNLGAKPSHPEVLVGQIVSRDAGFALRPKSLVPLAKLVAEAGNTTAKVGKWHLCGSQFTAHPQEFGWQHYRGVLANVQGDDVGYRKYSKVIDGTAGAVSGRYLTTDETNDALAFIRDGIHLISLSYHAPHKPWHEPPPDLHTVEPLDSDTAKARAMLEACDRELGRILPEAISAGYTVIVFSDNGAPVEIGGRKGSGWDAGFVVPMWAAGPGVKPGDDATLISAMDLYATVLDLFSIEHTGETRGPDSISFAPTLAGQEMPITPRFTEMFKGLGKDPRGRESRWTQVVRGPRFKLLRRPPGGVLQLFDLQEDPGERIELIRRGNLSEEAQAFRDTYLPWLARD